jgi:hypothetical protein
MKTLFRFGLLLACVVGCASAPAGELKSLRGFSLTYPDGWLAASSDQRDALTKELKPWLDKVGKLDLSRLAAVIVHPQDDGFVESVNVIVAPGAPKADAEGQQKYREGLVSQFSQVGLAVQNVEVEQATIGGTPALAAHWNVTVPGEKEPVRQWQVVIPGRSQTYIATCSARASEFSQYEPAFRQTIESLKIDAGPGGLWYSLPGPLRFAIVGGLVGLLVGVFRAICG